MSNNEIAQEIAAVLAKKKLSARSIRRKMHKDIKLAKILWILNHYDFLKIEPPIVGSGKSNLLVFKGN